MTKDKRFSSFLPGGDDRAWNTAAAHYNLNDDDGLLYADTYPIQYLQLHRNPKKRTRAQKITDLDQFIQTILGFLPNMYLEWRFKTTANGWNGITTILREYYGIKSNARSLLDFAGLKKDKNENYSVFY